MLVALFVFIFKVHALDLFFLRKTPLDQPLLVPLCLEFILEGPHECVISIRLLVSLESLDELSLLEVKLVLPEVASHTDHALNIIGVEGFEPLFDGGGDPLGGSEVKGGKLLFDVIEL